MNSPGVPGSVLRFASMSGANGVAKIRDLATYGSPLAEIPEALIPVPAYPY